MERITYGGIIEMKTNLMDTLKNLFSKSCKELEDTEKIITSQRVVLAELEETNKKLMELIG